MKKTDSSQHGIFYPRIIAGFVCVFAGIALALFSVASTPDHGTLSEGNPVLEYDAGPFNVPNESPAGLGQLDVGPRCDGVAFQCDSYQLNTNITTPGTAIKVILSWTDIGAKQSDYDLYVFKGVMGDPGGSTPADFQSASGANPEIASIFPVATGPQTYTIKIVPYTPTHETVHVRIELITGVDAPGFPGFGSADPVAPGVPRFMNFYAPIGSSAEPSNGEINVGYNPSTHRIMLMNSGPIWRVTPPEWLLQAKPECCEGMWEDVTNVSTIAGLDPILWTDSWTDPALPIPGATPTSGARTFAANSTAGTNGVYAYSDTDGGTGVGAPPDWFPLSISPPNASSDHETIGSGPYWPVPNPLGGTLPNPNATAANHGHAIYYCAQTFPVGAAACQRSDTYGTSYGPSIVMYNPNGPGQGYPSPAPSPLPVIPTNTQCAGIHGHVHVGPDGTVYVPVRDCGDNAGLVYSTDGGVTWNERVVPNSPVQQHGSDPSIAIGGDNTLYYFYVSSENQGNEGHMYVQITNNITSLTPTWSAPFDLGASHGIKNAVFPEAVAASFGPNVVPADGARAAVGFVGTDQAGYYEGASFPGVWYLFIATTFDHGAHWSVVNATPNDPVQGKIGIWQGGGSNANRNLLDFNEVTLDERGRILLAYDDGCVGDCISDPSKGSYGARMRVARQIGGKSLISAFDHTTDTTTALPAKAACLSGTRDNLSAHLEWVAPDGGGADIVGYQIFREHLPAQKL